MTTGLKKRNSLTNMIVSYLDTIGNYTSQAEANIDGDLVTLSEHFRHIEEAAKRAQQQIRRSLGGH